MTRGGFQRGSRAPWCWATAALMLLAGCNGTPEPAAVDLAGQLQHPLRRSPGAVHVVILLSHECPIANAYAPRLRELATEFDAAAVQWYCVHVATGLTATTARQHAGDYQLPGKVLLDPAHRIAAALGARRTPEAFVLADTGEGPWAIAYRGRIDDQWQAIGARAAAASEHSLRDAVAAALRGERPATTSTEPVGCLLLQPQR